MATFQSNPPPIRTTVSELGPIPIRSVKLSSSPDRNFKVMERLFRRDMKFKETVEPKLTKGNPLGSLELYGFMLWETRGGHLQMALEKAGATGVKTHLAFGSDGVPMGFTVSWDFDSLKNKFDAKKVASKKGGSTTHVLTHDEFRAMQRKIKGIRTRLENLY